MNLAYLLPPEIKELGLFPPNTTIWEGNVPEFSSLTTHFYKSILRPESVVFK